MKKQQFFLIFALITSNALQSVTIKSIKENPISLTAIITASDGAWLSTEKIEAGSSQSWNPTEGSTLKNVTITFYKPSRQMPMPGQPPIARGQYERNKLFILKNIPLNATLDIAIAKINGNLVGGAYDEENNTFYYESNYKNALRKLGYMQPTKLSQ